MNTVLLRENKNLEFFMYSKTFIFTFFQNIQFTSISQYSFRETIHEITNHSFQKIKNYNNLFNERIFFQLFSKICENQRI